jgi:DNA polymerase I-like protein with 3'-5' exonuclease and polymerase domains
MLEYCEQDVAVTREIFFKQTDFAQKYQLSVELEHNIASIIAEQIDNGFGFNVEAAHELEHDLLMEKVLIEDEMATIFPPIVEERWSEKTGKRLKDKVTHFNPGSRKQISERLREKYGWVAPKTEKGNPKVDAAVLKELPYDEAKTLVLYFDTVKMLSQVSDWILRSVSSRDGRIHGGVNSQGTVTGRMTASQPNLQQVSSNPRTRRLFVPRDGWVQVGIDASGLEARLLANRMAKWDSGKYAEVVLNGDIHDYNMKQAGLTSRAQTKTFFYGFIYGAGDTKIGKIIGKKTKDGKALKERFLNSMPALKKLIQNCQYQVAKKNTITLLDGREVPCRAKHKALNVQIQGDGAILMKVAQRMLHSKLKMLYGSDVRFMATVHDEWQLECPESIANAVGKLGASCIKEAGKALSCLVDMDGDYRIGSNWAECH